MKREEFCETFLSVFANGIKERQKRKYRIGLEYGGYLWHLFYYNLVPVFIGDEARKEYNKVDKNGAVQIQYDLGIGYGDEETLSLEDNFLTAEGIDKGGYCEFYVIGKDFSWCYIVTHENDSCGPYFCYAPVTKNFN